MKNSIIIFILLIHGAQSINPPRAAGLLQFPYYVSIWKFCSFSCSGTLISQFHVITAGHCVNDILPENLFILAGTMHFPSEGGYLEQVEKIWLHDHFTETPNLGNPINKRYSNDIAIIKVVNSFQNLYLAVPINLINNPKHINILCLVPGWNEISLENGETSLSAVWINGNSIKNRECSYYGINLLTNERCIEGGIRGQKNAGSPFTCDDRLCGIIVDNSEIRNTPLIVLNIFPYFEWIDYIINDGAFDVDSRDSEYIVSIRYNKIHSCGGTLVSPFVVLTAASCLENMVKSDIKIISGKSQLRNIPYFRHYSWSHVRNIIRYENFYQTPDDYLKNDIAILTLQRTVFSGNYPLPQLEQREHYPQENCRIIRWVANRNYLKLQAAPSILLPFDDCDFDVNADARRDGCISNSNNSPISNAISYGNPVMCGNNVVGIIVRTFINEKGEILPKTTFTKISYYYDFITNITNQFP